MPAPFAPARVLWVLLPVMVLAGVACSPAAQAGAPGVPDAQVAPSAPAQATLPPTPTQWPTPVNQPWRTIALGVERRDVETPADYFRFPATVYLVRLDPALVKIHTHYSPEVPISVGEWQRETRALVVVNGGFFTSYKRSEGLMVSFGNPYGISYRDGGMFYIQNGQPGILELTELGLDDDESKYEEAIQAYPLLVREGGFAAVSGDDQRYNRRTAIAIDTQGRIILVVISEPVISLYELSRWLAASDLDVDVALNLDGGSSTGLAIATEAEQLVLESGGPVPIVIAAYP